MNSTVKSVLLVVVALIAYDLVIKGMIDKMHTA